MDAISNNHIYDLFIIGGGINGVGIAADAAGRGLSVMLCEQHDLASGTSSSSTKLIHGGLRYLEYYEFKLVHEALLEREILLNKAPHIIKPLSFVMPHNKKLRPLWLIRLGLFLYDHLARRQRLPGSHLINLTNSLEGAALKKGFRRGFTYSDCWVDDARLVVLNAISARDDGANIVARTKCTAAIRHKEHWEIKLQDSEKAYTVKAKVLINAAGPWVTMVTNNIESDSKHNLRLVKGSHIVIPRSFQGEHAYILQNKDKRVIFAIPYEHKYTLIGTTEVAFEGDPETAKISEQEKQYLCDSYNRYFEKSLHVNDIVWSYSGVRPLLEDESETASKVSRDYKITVEKNENEAPLVTIHGGKITTYRTLAEHTLTKLKNVFPDMGGAWTAEKKLPGGTVDPAILIAQLAEKHPWLAPSLINRYAYTYGDLAKDILDSADNTETLGELFGADLYECEVLYLIKNEWAKTAEDILWRRTKLGLNFSEKEIIKLENFLEKL